MNHDLLALALVPGRGGGADNDPACLERRRGCVQRIISSKIELAACHARPVVYLDAISFSKHRVGQ